MRWLCALFAAAVASPVVSAQESATIKRTLPEAPVLWESNGASPFACSERGPSNRFAGNHNFDCFIGFMSVPLFNIDPRAVTELPMTDRGPAQFSVLFQQTAESQPAVVRLKVDGKAASELTLTIDVAPRRPKFKPPANPAAYQ